MLIATCAIFWPETNFFVFAFLLIFFFFNCPFCALLFCVFFSFCLDTPYTLTGKSHGSVAEQYKKRSHVYLPAGTAFPSHLKRLPVAQRQEIIMTPLQCVLEDIHRRVAKLRVEVSSEK